VTLTPQTKGKIERCFGTFLRRLVTLLSHANVRDFFHTEEVLQIEIQRQNLTRTTAQIPGDLHLSLRCSRRVNNDYSIDFDGLRYQIAPTLRKSVTVRFHPN